MSKKSIFITIIAFVLSCLVVVIGRHPYSMYAKAIGINNYGNNPREVYRVYLAGDSLGIIKSKRELEKYIDDKQEELKKKYHVKKVHAPNDLKIIKEITYNEDTIPVKNVYDKIKEIKGDSSFTIDGYIIEIRTEEKTNETEKIDASIKTFYVLDKKIFESAVKKTITAFIEPEIYESYLNDTQKELKENETGSIIDKIYIDNNITITKGRIPTGDDIFVTEEDLSKFLLFGTTKEQESYSVQSGDTIATIANDHKLSVEEFLIANTEFKSADDLLYQGQVVKLGLITPQFDLVEEMTVSTEKAINKTTVYKDDDTQYVGYEKVEEEGQDGLALVTEKQKIINGEIKDIIPMSNIEITPAVNKVVVRGTKQYYSGVYGNIYEVPVGIGSWVWPTNSPYTINSPFGWRWGKLHQGVDIGGTGHGSPIYAANNGIVVASTYNGTNGNYVLIRHEGDYYTMYAHLASRNKQSGDVVMAGDQIGTMGMTGFATGVHLHFAIYRGYPYRGGVPFNPFNIYQ